MDLQVSINNNSFNKLGITKDCKEAICEYIWNGFEAGATNVSVEKVGELLQQSYALVVNDNGSGIHYNSLDETFGTLLSSLKNNTHLRIKSQSNKGKGRFSYQALSNTAKWTTIFEDSDKLMKYTIHSNINNRSKFTTSNPTEETKQTHTGTTVEFPIANASTMQQLQYQKIRQKLFEEFAWYLYLNKDKNMTLDYMGNKLNISEYINVSLSNTYQEILGDHSFKITIIVWNNYIANSSKIYYSNELGETKLTENTSYNKNRANSCHAVYVSSKFFNNSNVYAQSDENTDQIDISAIDNTLVVPSKLRAKISELVQNTLKSFLVQKADKMISDMEKRGSLPTFSDDKYGELRKKDFDRVTRELYCTEPQIFYKLNKKQEQSLLGLINLLLSSEERENLLTIIEQIVNLTPEQRKTFADILQRSKLQYIIDAINNIEKRITIIKELKRIVFDLSSFANERNHIQKIIEQHFWLFGEQYHLLTADKTLKRSLQKFEEITLDTQQAEAIINKPEYSQRIDVFLYSKYMNENDNSEMLIIELKAPNVILSTEVFGQIERYANILRKEPRFLSQNRIWKFYTICSKIDDDITIKYENFKQHGKKGLANIIGNFELYALTWDDIFQAFEARHKFLIDKLKFDFDELSDDDEIIDSRSKVDELSKKLVAISAI